MKVIWEKIVLLSFLLLYIGCGELEENTINVDKNEKNNSELNVTNKEVKKEILNQLGLDIKNQKISIDFNKTSNFFKKMEIQMHSKADEFQYKIDKADINFTRDIGFKVANKKIEIDLNKTKKMFQQINIIMKEVLLDKNSSKY